MIKVGLIGCGFMGTMHANCYKNIEGVELAAVADLCKEKAEKAYQVGFWSMHNIQDLMNFTAYVCLTCLYRDTMRI